MNSFKDFIIYGKLVPCTEFIETDNEEKKKEMWVKVLSDDPAIQKWIDREIWYAKTTPHRIYMLLNEDHNLEFYGYYKVCRGIPLTKNIHFEQIEGFK